MLTHLALLCELLPHQVVAVLTNCVVATLALPVPLYVSGCVIAVAPFCKFIPLAPAVYVVYPPTTRLAEVAPTQLCDVPE